MTQTNTPAQPAAPQKITLEQAMEQAMQAHGAGQYQQAEIQLRQILAVQPQHAFALHLLGVLAHQAGKTDDAIALISRAIKSLPTVPVFYSNLGEMCRLQGRLEEAVKHGQMAITLDPSAAAAHSNLGIAYFDLRDFGAAEACQRQALRLNPVLAAALNNLGSIARERKDKDGAIALYRQALAAAPQYLESISNLGAVLCEQDQPEAAIKVLLSALQINPNYADAHCNIANAFLSSEDYDKATVGFTRALTLRPNYTEAMQGMARLQQERKQLADAESWAQRALASAPQRAEIHALLGGIFMEDGYPEKAELAYQSALALDPDLVSGYLGKGQLLMEQGKMDESDACFKHALALDPANLSARLSITQVKKVKADDSNMAALVQEAEKLEQMSEQRALSLHFALGKCYDDTKQYELAFKHYLEGCRLKRKRTNYSADDNELTVRNIKSVFTRDMIERLGGGGCSSDTPIFVLGMPRSGTTLTEQIIASHPLVHGAGELHDLLEVVCLDNAGVSGNYPFSAQNITPELLRERGELYVSKVQARSPNARHISDKMPANFNSLGMIHLMLPNAKIVHVKRNPVDVCLSGFTRLFNKSQHQSYDLAEMGRYYRSYHALMQHWREVLPANAFYEVQYEDLVADNENQARALINYCGLEWNDACLESHKTERSIRTASVAQVRQPIYSSSVERWRKYEPYLGPLLEVLGDLVPPKQA